MDLIIPIRCVGAPPTDILRFPNLLQSSTFPTFPTSLRGRSAGFIHTVPHQGVVGSERSFHRSLSPSHGPYVRPGVGYRPSPSRKIPRFAIVRWFGCDGHFHAPHDTRLENKEVYRRHFRHRPDSLYSQQKTVQHAREEKQRIGTGNSRTRGVCLIYPCRGRSDYLDGLLRHPILPSPPRS